MLSEIARIDSELEAAREGHPQGAEVLEEERRAHSEARALAEERIAAQDGELQDLRGQIEGLRIEAATLAERATHAEELRGLVKCLQAGQGRGASGAAVTKKATTRRWTQPEG